MRHSRQRRGQAASHADDWLMTYADMITLLLCFFAIFLSVSIPKKDVQQKLHLPQAVEQPKHPPDILKGDLPFYGLPHLAQPGDDKGDDVTVPVKKIPEKIPDNVMPLTEAKTAEISGEGDKSGSGDVVADVEPIPPSDRAYASLLAIIERLKLQGGASIQRQGERITTLQMSSSAFFDVGSATLNDSGKAILRDIAVNIKTDRYRPYQVTVEGHTDDSPIRTPQFPSNWELSTARAAAVVRFFIEDGVDTKRLRAAGYADTFPVAPNRAADGAPIPENQARNRRVVIKLEKRENAE